MSHEPPGDSRRPRRLGVWLASAAAVVGIATGILTLRDQIFPPDTTNTGPSPPPAENGTIPYFSGSVGHLENSRDFIGFLQKHDGDAVRLDAGFRVTLDDFRVEGFGVKPNDSEDYSWVVLYERCDPPLSPAEKEKLDFGSASARDELSIPGRCFGSELYVQSPNTDDSGIYVAHGTPRMEGYFAVNMGDLQMGFEGIRIRPIEAVEAHARS